jgi:hypothetical protein
VNRYHMPLTFISGEAASGVIDAQTELGGMTFAYIYYPASGMMDVGVSFRRPEDFPTVMGMDTAMRRLDDARPRSQTKDTDFTWTYDVGKLPHDRPEYNTVADFLVMLIKSGAIKRRVHWWNNKVAGKIFGLLRMDG